MTAPDWSGLADEMPHVLRFCRHGLGLPRDRADDVAQETLLRAARYRASQREGSLRNWLFSIAANVSRDSQRRARSLPVVDVDSLPARLHPVCAVSEPDPEWYDAARVNLYAALADVRPNHVDTLAVGYGSPRPGRASGAEHRKGIPQANAEAVAEAQGCSREIAKMRLHRARLAVQIALGLRRSRRSI